MVRSLVAVAATLLLLGTGAAPALAVVPAQAAQQAPRISDGYCPGSTGVTVVVDFQELGGGTLIKCAVGAQSSGLAALENAGYIVTGTQRWGKAFICRINNQPGPERESCVNTPPASAYWGYWHAPNGGSWTYSQQGATGRTPPQGSFEGWSFSLNRTSTTNPPPRVAPVRPAARTASLATEPASFVSEPASFASGSAAFAPTPGQLTGGRDAGRWISGELEDGRIVGSFGPDWGLTIDTLFLLRSTRADDTAAEEILDALAPNVNNYATDAGFNGTGVPTMYFGGATAKVLAAVVAGERDTSDFGGHDVRQRVLDLVQGPGDPEPGRISDAGSTEDYSNTFGQALGVIGLAGSDGGVPQPVVDHLLRQQCPAGGFRLGGFGNGDPTCTADADADPDSTAMAVQALLDADEAGATGAQQAATEGAEYLLDIQGADGSFGGSGPTAASNTNSTGLAGAALAAAGYETDAREAADWVLDHQLSVANAGPLTGDLGAIAYNEEGRTTAQAEPDGNRIPQIQRDQWRRATAQAGLVLGAAQLGHTGPVPGDPDPTDPVPTPTPTLPPLPGPDPVPNPVVPTPAPVTTTVPVVSANPTPVAQQNLAYTGAPVFELLGAAALLLVAGVGLGVAGRRRSRA